MVVSNENIDTGKSDPGRMKPRIIHPSGNISHNNVTGKAQKGQIRILSRKNGKGTVTNGKENEEIKLTKVLEFVPARKPEQAKIGEVVRFMHNPGNGLSTY